MTSFQWRPDRRTFIASVGAVIGDAACAASVNDTLLELDLCHAPDSGIRRLISFRRNADAWALGSDGRLKRFPTGAPRRTEFGLMLEGVTGSALLPDDSFRVSSSGNYYCSGGYCTPTSPMGGFPEGRVHVSDGWPQGGLAYYVPLFASAMPIRIQVWFSEPSSGRVFHEFARSGRPVLRIEGPAETPEVTLGEAWSVLVEDYGDCKMLSYCFAPGRSDSYCEFKTGSGSGVKGQSLRVLGIAASSPNRYLFAPAMGQKNLGGDVALAQGPLAHALSSPVGAMVIECAAVQYPGAILGDASGRTPSLVASGPTTLSAFDGDHVLATAAVGGWRGQARVALAWDERSCELCFNGGACVRTSRILAKEGRMRFMPSALGYLRRISAVARRATSEELRGWTRI